MTETLHHPHESTSNAVRDRLARYEPRTLRTYTPTQAVLAHSAGVFHWTPEGRRALRFLVGRARRQSRTQSASWMQQFIQYMGWTEFDEPSAAGQRPPANTSLPCP